MELHSAPRSALAGLRRDGVLSLEQIKALRCSNEYSEGPSSRQPSSRQPPPRAPLRPDKPERTHEVIRVTLNNNSDPAPLPSRTPPPRLLPISRSASSGSSSSGGSEQGLLGCGASGRAVRTQPPRAAPSAPLKPEGAGPADAPHRLVCERCGRCKCAECVAPRALPSCLACGGQCVCSAQTALDHATCMCLVKGLFYHCSDDDAGDSCADRPCSLSRAHCCSRFLCMGFLSAIFPCLLCYPPAKAGLSAAQRCYDRATRPGCQCRNSNTVYCKLDNWSPRSPHKPS